MHNGLISKEKWESLSTYSQMANIGSEVGRAFKWKKAGAQERAKSAYLRAFELFEATLNDPKNFYRSKEVRIARELFSDLFLENSLYKETPEHLEKYFTEFAILSRSYS